MALLAPTLFASFSATSGALQTLTTTTTAPIVAGNLACVVVGFMSGISTPTLAVASVTDGTNTYSRVVGPVYGANPSAQYGLELWQCENALAVASGATLTATLNNAPGGNNGGSLYAFQASGVKVSAAVDKTVTTPSGSYTSATTTLASGTLAQATELVIGCSVQWVGSKTYTAGTPGWTTLINGLPAGQVSTLGLDYLITNSTPSVSYNPTWSGAGSWGTSGILVSFEAAPGTVVPTPFVSATASLTNVSVITGTTSAAIGAGNLAFVHINWPTSGSALTVSSVTDGTNTYSRVGTTMVGGSSYPMTQEFWQCENCLAVAAGATFTVTLSGAITGNNGYGVFGFQAAGIKTASAVDKVVQLANNASTATVSLASGTLAQANELVVAFSVQYYGNRTYTPPGWTGNLLNFNPSGYQTTVGGDYLITGGTGSVTYAPGWSAAGQYGTTGILVSFEMQPLGTTYPQTVNAACHSTTSVNAPLSKLHPPTIFASVSNTSYVGATPTATTTAAIVAGNLAVVVLEYASAFVSTITVNSVTDGINAYTRVAGPIAGTANQCDLEVWACENAQAVASGATLTVTLSASLTGGYGYGLFGFQVKGVLPPPPTALDKVVTTPSGSFSSATVSLASGTLATATEMVVGVSVQWNVANTYTPAAGFTNLINANPASGASTTLGLDYKMTAGPSSVTYAPGWTAAGGWGTAGVLFSYQAQPPGALVPQTVNAACHSATSVSAGVGRRYNQTVNVGCTTTTSVTKAQGNTRVLLLTSGTTWNYPGDWNPVGATIDCIGGGAFGGTGFAPGGGGGAWSRVTSPATTGTFATINIPPVTLSPPGINPTDTWMNWSGGSTPPTSTAQGCLAKSGGTAPAAGLAASCIGTTAFSGGAGAALSGGVGGGGGAGGPNGAGVAGVVYGPSDGGGGAGGAGDNGFGGAGGAGGGYGGPPPTPGQPGAEYRLSTGGTAGSGGGSGGPGQNSGFGSAMGGAYGGGGAAGQSQTGSQPPGTSGAAGAILITYQGGPIYRQTVNVGCVSTTGVLHAYAKGVVVNALCHTATLLVGGTRVAKIVAALGHTATSMLFGAGHSAFVNATCTTTTSLPAKKVIKWSIVACASSVGINGLNGGIINKTIAVTCHSATSVGKFVARTLQVGCHGAVSVVYGAAHPWTVNVACSTATVVTKLLPRMIAATCVSATSLTNQVSKAIAATCKSGVSWARSIAKQINVLCHGTVVFLATKAFLGHVNAMCSSVVTLTPAPAIFRGAIIYATCKTSVSIITQATRRVIERIDVVLKQLAGTFVVKAGK